MNIRVLDKAFSVATIILGCYVLYEAVQYGYWVRGAPGSGFFPLIASLGMIILGTINLWRSVSGKEVINNDLNLEGILKSLAIMAAVIAFIFFSQYFGMLISSAVMVFIIGVIIETKKTKKFYIKIGSIAFIFPFVAYFLFSYYLKVPLVEGVLKQ